jgi:nicotinamide-nucleotide adenylyltransferase
MRPTSERTCVFPGRFQPFHNGHAAALGHAASTFEHVIVAISNAHISHTATDPLTGGERFSIIDAWARELRIRDRISLIPVPVDDEPTTWVATIKAIAPPFQFVYTRSAWTASLFNYWGIPNSESLIEENTLSASEVRQAISQGLSWRTLVPACVGSILEDCGATQRIAALSLGKNARLSS